MARCRRLAWPDSSPVAACSCAPRFRSTPDPFHPQCKGPPMYSTHLLFILAGNVAAACTPDSGMGCFPCCGVTSSTTTVDQSGSAALGAAVLCVAVLLLRSWLG